jgi:hypothetical protein
MNQTSLIRIRSNRDPELSFHVTNATVLERSDGSMVYPFHPSMDGQAVDFKSGRKVLRHVRVESSNLYDGQLAFAELVEAGGGTEYLDLGECTVSFIPPKD